MSFAYTLILGKKYIVGYIIIRKASAIVNIKKILHSISGKAKVRILNDMANVEVQSARALL